MVFDGLDNANCHISVSLHDTLIEYILKLVTYLCLGGVLDGTHPFLELGAICGVWGWKKCL